MRLNNLVAKPFLLAAAFVLLAACHDDDKPEPEHEGEGQLIVTVENPGAQALALRIFGDGLTEPLESRFDAANATGKLDKWLPAGQYFCPADIRYTAVRSACNVSLPCI